MNVFSTDRIQIIKSFLGKNLGSSSWWKNDLFERKNKLVAAGLSLRNLKIACLPTDK